MSAEQPRQNPRWFGRRTGRKLRPGRQRLLDELLPRLRLGLDNRGALDHLAGQFQRPVDDVWMEIGFGAGEHLAGQAAGAPDIGFIGCEPFVNGVASLLAQVEDQDLGNIRVFDDDARLLMAALPDACLGRLYVLYSDPWPKSRHHNRRLTVAANIEQFARLLRPGAEFRFATDHAEFAAWTLERVLRQRDFDWSASSSADWRQPPADWIETRYESKAADQGRAPIYLNFLRR